jgi:hypothetical protein
MSASSQYQNEPGARHDESGELFESFAAPRTVPGGWDLSELISSGNGRPARTEGAAAASIDPPEAGGTEHPTTAERDRFPKPNTYPSQWDLSA